MTTRSPAVRRALTLLAAALAALAAVPVAGARAAGSAAPAVQSASVAQVGAQLRWTIKLHHTPAADASECLLVRYGTTHRPRAQICIAGAPAALHYAQLSATGALLADVPLAGTITGAKSRLTATFATADAHLSLRSYRWQVVAATPCPTAAAPTAVCATKLPKAGSVAARTVAPPGPQPVGCTPTGAPQVFQAPGSPQTVALTFDDGPGISTASILDVLEAEKVPATFFTIGRQVAGDEALLQRELADGDAIGDHTWDHPDMSGGGRLDEITRTQAAIKAATGYTPCLLRPPYGATSAALLAELAPLHLTSVLWNVDPADWSSPGTAAIENRVLAQAKPGSIILMHDGGGSRAQTAAALPAIIHALATRGYRFATVPDLLGYTTQTAPAAPLPPTTAKQPPATESTTTTT